MLSAADFLKISGAVAVFGSEGPSFFAAERGEGLRHPAGLLLWTQLVLVLKLMNEFAGRCTADRLIYNPANSIPAGLVAGPLDRVPWAVRGAVTLTYLYNPANCGQFRESA